jgi:hypothetical protein
VQFVVSTPRAILIKFYTTGIVAAILFGRVVAFLAIRALQGNYRSDVFCHNILPSTSTVKKIGCKSLFDDLSDHACADGEAAFTNGELGALL